jgi:hypothetical protein
MKKTNIFGDTYYNNKGELHRDDGPAIEYANGYKEWYKNGKLHRDDGPAVEYVNGDKEWWLNGKKTTKNRVLNIKIQILEQTKFNLKE